MSLDSETFAQTFSGEFWSLYQATESDFRNKDYVREWLRALTKAYAGPQMTQVRTPMIYDVFLCHNSADKAAVRRLAKSLRGRGIQPWFDEDCLIPGRPWQRALEAQIGSIGSAAILVGASGLGPWHEMELEAFIREFVKRDVPVIPTVLRGTTSVPALPIFLQGMHWVDFRRRTPNPMNQLIAGINGTLK